MRMLPASFRRTVSLNLARFSSQGSKQTTSPSRPTRRLARLEKKPQCAPTSQNLSPGPS